jgi:hypothetical protein
MARDFPLDQGILKEVLEVRRPVAGKVVRLGATKTSSRWGKIQSFVGDFLVQPLELRISPIDRLGRVSPTKDLDLVIIGRKLRIAPEVVRWERFGFRWWWRSEEFEVF